MTTERRLAKLEASLNPTGIVLRWLTEARAFDDLDDYAAWLLDQPTSVYPLDRVAKEASDWATAAARGQSREASDKALRNAVLEPIFRIDLILRINVVTEERIEREVLLQTVLSLRQAMLTSICPPPGGLDPSRTREERARVERLIIDRTSDLAAVELARTKVEAKYLGGHGALLPAVFRRWTALRQDADLLAGLAVRLAELDGVDVPEPPSEAAGEQITALMADLVEPARVTALEKLGEGYRAHAIAVRWLRPKLVHGPSAV